MRYKGELADHRAELQRSREERNTNLKKVFEKYKEMYPSPSQKLQLHTDIMQHLATNFKLSQDPGAERANIRKIEAGVRAEKLEEGFAEIRRVLEAVKQATDATERGEIEWEQKP